MSDHLNETIINWTDFMRIVRSDYGDDAFETKRLTDVAGSSNGPIPIKPALMPSILIQSLIQQLGSIFVHDSNMGEQLYAKLCDVLHQHRLIDDSYIMDKFDLTRQEFRDLFHKLVSIANIELNHHNLEILRIASKESRLCKEFKNLENIGAGGSGCVYKAIHRLDDQQCAIKRIKEKKGFEHEIDLNFAIIKKLAMFTHPNIVPYKDVWIERVSQPPSPTTSESSDSSEDTKALSNNEYPLNSNSNPNSPTESHELNPIESSDDSDEQQIHPNDRNGDGNVKHQLTKINKFDNINKTADSNVISNDDKSDESDGISFRGGSSTGSNDRSIPSPSDPVIPMDDNKEEGYRILYIHMALCEQTLREWIDKQTEPISEISFMLILTQILAGLHYIHSNGIIHRDIKPSNIFTTNSKLPHIQLGDFGLACFYPSVDASPGGTLFYAAPEQKKEPSQCSAKSDIYSLGIVLIELIFPMKTRMEHAKMIEGFKSGNIPQCFIDEYPKLSKLIKKLVDESPDNRPSAQELLREIIEDKDFKITQLTNENADKEALINNLEQKNLELHEELRQLQDDIKNLKIGKNITDS